MLPRMRECGKLGCRLPAVATAALRYRQRVLWIGLLGPQRDPNLLDLCQAHAASITAPYGWERLDERPPPTPHAATA
jgi:hypothetical protein